MLKLTKEEINHACDRLRKLLEEGNTGEFSIKQKVFVEVYNEPRRA